MNFLDQVGSWFTTSAHWTGTPTNGTEGLLRLFAAQLELSLAVVAAAVIVGGGIGLVVGHFGRGGLVALNFANAARAIPTLGLLTLLAVVPAIGISWTGFLPSFLALTALAIPPILTNTFVGVRGVDADAKDAARGMGLGHLQMMGRVEVPLALPSILAGARVSAVEVVATSTLAAYVSYADLGTILLRGLAENKAVTAFCGAVAVGVTAALVAVAFGLLQRVLTPAPLRHTAPGLLAAGTRGAGGAV